MFDMRTLLAIAIGGGIGSVMRHIVSTSMQNTLGPSVFPWGILFVNITGCLLIGMVAQAGESSGLLTPTLRALLITGFLGGYTTYSTFASQAFDLASASLPWQSLVYIVLHVALGLVAVWMGHVVVARIVGN